jgi:hypothetical protein
MGDLSFPRRTFSFVPRSKYLAAVAFAPLVVVAALSALYLVYYLGLFGRKG